MAQDLKKTAEEISRLVKNLAKTHAKGASHGKTRVHKLFTRIKRILPVCPCLYMPHCVVDGVCQCDITSSAACTRMGGYWVNPRIRPPRGRKKA
jgi:hypothetical protein